MDTQIQPLQDVRGIDFIAGGLRNSFDEEQLDRIQPESGGVFKRLPPPTVLPVVDMDGARHERMARVAYEVHRAYLNGCGIVQAGWGGQPMWAQEEYRASVRYYDANRMSPARDLSYQEIFTHAVVHALIEE